MPKSIQLAGKDPQFEIDVPGDGTCLFYSVTFSYLLPVIHDKDLFVARFIKIFGEEVAKAAEENRQLLLKYDGSKAFITLHADTLEILVNHNFRKRIVEFMHGHKSELKLFLSDDESFEVRMAKMANPVLKEWGDQLEIEAMSRFLEHSITVYQYRDEYIFPHALHGQAHKEEIHLIYTSGDPSSKFGRNHYHFIIDQRLIYQPPKAINSAKENAEATKFLSGTGSGTVSVDSLPKMSTLASATGWCSPEDLAIHVTHPNLVEKTAEINKKFKELILKEIETASKAKQLSGIQKKQLARIIMENTIQRLAKKYSCDRAFIIDAINPDEDFSSTLYSPTVPKLNSAVAKPIKNESPSDKPASAQIARVASLEKPPITSADKSTPVAPLPVASTHINVEHRALLITDIDKETNILLQKLKDIGYKSRANDSVALEILRPVVKRLADKCIPLTPENLLEAFKETKTNNPIHQILLSVITSWCKKENGTRASSTLRLR